MSELIHSDGSISKKLKEGTDDNGPYLIVEHFMPQPKMVNGPHWHPVLEEHFLVKEGTMRFLLNGEEINLQAGDHITVQSKDVHQFWNADSNLVVEHTIRPPLNHWKMFQLIHKLNTEGKLNAKGMPKSPFWIGVAWQHMDGYIQGPPVWIQKTLLGGLGRIGTLFGHRIHS